MNKLLVKLFFILFLFTIFGSSNSVPVISDRNSKIIVGTTSILLASCIGYKTYKYCQKKSKEIEDNQDDSKLLLKSFFGVCLPAGILSTLILKFLFYDYFSESASHWKKAKNSTSDILKKFLNIDSLNLREEYKKKYLKQLLDELEGTAMSALTELKMPIIFDNEALDSFKNNEIVKEFYRVHGMIKEQLNSLN